MRDNKVDALDAYVRSLDKKKGTEMNQTTTGGGIGFTGVLFITFLVLKLTHVINWSWWWVTAPLWGPLALFAVIMLFIAIIAFIFSKD